MTELALRIRCTYCHDGLEPGTAVHCASCLAPHHAECQAAHGRCAAPGCDDPRVLVPDPAGRAARAPEREAARRTSGKKGAKGDAAIAPASSWRRVAAAVLALALAGFGAFMLWPEEPAPIASPPVVATPVVPPTPVTPRGPQPRLVHEGPATGVSLVARDFTLPVVLAHGERLVVSAKDQGYTHVVLEPPADSFRKPETRMVAEPGDAIDVVTGPRERLRAGPGEAIVVERGDGESVRVLVIPAS